MGCLVSLILLGISAGIIFLFGVSKTTIIILIALWILGIIFTFIFGHRGFGTGANTDLMILIFVLGISLAIAVPYFHKREQKMSYNQTDNIALPEGWRYLTTEELSNQSWRQNSPTKYAKLVADFNGDGIDDNAYILKNTNFSREGLFVHLSDKQAGFKWLLLDTTDLARTNLYMGIDAVKPGEYITACGKGYFKCKKGEPAILKIERPAINYFQFESVNSFFVWNDKTRLFKQIWISD